MNRVREIERINQRELEMGGNGTNGSWHDEYKDSAYIYVGGLPDGITEGDLVTVCSQYGEIVDVNMPRDKETGKTRGFGFIMYEDQRSTILAVDNLSGGKVLDRIIRVDHVKNYKQPKERNAEGEWQDRDEQSLNALPKLVRDGVEHDDESVSSVPSIDPEDPMRDYLLQKHKELKMKSKKRKHGDETPEERRARKEKKRAKREAKARTVEDSTHQSQIEARRRQRSSLHTPPRKRSPSPMRARPERIGMSREGDRYDSGARRERDSSHLGQDLDRERGPGDERDHDRPRARERSRDRPWHDERRRPDLRKSSQR